MLTGPAKCIQACSVWGPPIRPNMNWCSVQYLELLWINLTEPNFGNNPCFLSISTSWTHIIWLSAIWSSSFLPLQWPILSHEWQGIHSQYALNVFYLLKFSVLPSDTYCSPSPTQACFITHEQLSSHFSKSCCFFHLCSWHSHLSCSCCSKFCFSLCSHWFCSWHPMGTQHPLSLLEQLQPH